MAKYDPNTVVTLPLSDIHVDYKWNARRELFDTAQETGESSTGYLDLAAGIAEDGQKTPVVVRPHPKAGQSIAGKKMPHFFLCSGFSRAKIISELAAGGVRDDELVTRGILPSKLAALKTDKPTIRVFVRDLNDFEARKENLEENTKRSALSAPDIAFGMADLFKLDKALTTEKAGEMLGVSPAYAGALRSTYEGLKSVNVPADHPLNPDKSKDMNLAEVWRQEAVRPKKEAVLAVANLKVGKGDAAVSASSEEKLAAYMKARAPKTSVARGPGAWVKNAVETNAVTIGTLLGNLARDGAIELVGITGKHVPTLLAPLQKLPKKADHEKMQKEYPNARLADYEVVMESIARAVSKAYQAGLAPPPVKDATEAAATTDGIPSPPEEPKTAGGKAKRNGAGSRATA